MFLKTFIHETVLSAIFQKPASSGAEGFRSLGSLPFSEEPKRIRQKPLGSLPKTESPKEWAFIKSDLKSASLLFSVEGYQKNGIYLLPTLPFSEDAQKNTP